METEHMEQVQILIVEDETIVALDVRGTLESLGYTVSDVASSGEEALTKAVETHPHLVLMDVKLKGAMDGVEAAARIRDVLDIPVIFLTAFSDEKTLGRAKVAQPFGYLLEPFERRELHTAIEMALYKHEMETKLKESERWLATTLKSIGDGLIVTDAQGAIVYVNPAFERITGYQRDEVLGQNPSLLKSGEHQGDLYQELWATITAGEVWQGRFVNKRKDGSLYTADTTIAPVCDENGGIMNYISLQRDVTRELQLEEQYYQVQKMKALGQLTAGIAHDFNNLLNVINGYAELVQLRLSPDSALQQPLENIRSAGRRAAGLVSQLLAFSSKQAVQPRDLNLNSVVAEMSQMLERIVGEHIEMETRLTSDLWQVTADPTQIEQVIVNLVVNARDAMPQAGHLIIETANVILDGEYVADHLGMWPGKYVQLAVSDTGMGMSEEVKSRIFEPFFTTKEVGEGTGLGLATVHGIVQQSDGHIWVYSEEGHGTTFKIYWPVAAEVTSGLERPEAKSELPSGHETILVVEDDLGVRELARCVLQAQGYTVLQARDGGEALHLCASHPEDIQLLLTDLMIPRMKGTELACELARSRPDVKVVFMSGYSDEVAVQNGMLEPGAVLLEKPFGSAALVHKVRDALDN
jgi:two-component system cell cycle sensor histidine kinase/response regulator CckA